MTTYLIGISSPLVPLEEKLISVKAGDKEEAKYKAKQLLELKGYDLESVGGELHHVTTLEQIEEKTEDAEHQAVELELHKEL